MQISEIHKILRAVDIPAVTIEPYRENLYLVDDEYVLKISTDEQRAKLDRVNSLRMVPKVHSSGMFGEYHYLIYDYIRGDELWNIAPCLTDEQQRSLGEEIAQFLNELHSIKGEFYDIGHYIPTVAKYEKSWKDGHLEYIEILQNGISRMELMPDSPKIIANAFDYIRANIDVLEHQTGPTLLHNDFHLKNIIVHEGKLAGVIDWECSQYGEADFELSRLFDWCIFPDNYLNRDSSLEILLKSVIKNMRNISLIPCIKKRITIYQLEHEINQLIWRGKKQENERIHRINEWLDSNVEQFL